MTGGRSDRKQGFPKKGRSSDPSREGIQMVRKVEKTGALPGTEKNREVSANINPQCGRKLEGP